MKKTFIILLLAATSSLYAWSESCFRLDLTKDAVMLGTSAALTGGSFLTGPTAVEQPAASSINAVDSALMFPYSEGIDKAATWGAIGMLVLPGTSALGFLDEPDTLLTYAIMYTEAFLYTMGTKEILKDLVSRYRPWTYSNLPGPADSAVEQYQSFPSGHTSYAFLGASFLSAVLVFDYSDEPWMPFAVAGSYVLASAVAAGRIASGEHFFTDVLAGAAVGSLFGWIVPVLHTGGGESEPGQPVVTLSGGSLGIRYSY